MFETQTKRAGLSVGLCLAAVPLLSVGPALLAGVSLSCCCPVFGVCVWAAGCVAARLVAAVQVFWGSPLCFLPPSSCLRGLGWLVSLQVPPGSFHVMTCLGYTQAQPCFRGLGVCVATFSKEVKLVPKSRGATP